jgi:hypothetical protein
MHISIRTFELKKKLYMLFSFLVINISSLKCKNLRVVLPFVKRRKKEQE